MRCINCGSSFPSKSTVNKHYKTEHQIEFVYEDLSFESADQFTKWINELHRTNICQFRRVHARQNASEMVLNYVCHRSGFYIPKEPLQRKRRLKEIGCKSLGGHCPAEIVARCNLKDRSYVVRYQKTHVGHQIGTESELQFIDLDKKEKLVIASKMKAAVPIIKILKKQCHRPKENDIRLNPPSVEEIQNLAKALGATGENARVLEDAVITQNSDSVLYFKDKWREDKYGVLEKNDFMIVIMNDAQKKNLCRYGSEVVAFHETYGASRDGFFLHSLLVVDADFEGLPVAFALTNRNDSVGVCAFLTCIRHKVGIINARTLISDMQLTYFDCWSRVMQPPERYLYCLWHIFGDLKRNVKKISNREKRKVTREKVCSMVYEMDRSLFQKKLQSFLSNKDEDMAHFMKYFHSSYSSCLEKWACCYRQEPELNINVYIERFCGMLKKNLAKCGKNGRIYSCLHFLLKYLKVAEKDKRSEYIRGRRTRKLRILRLRHRTAEKDFLETNSLTVEAVDGQMWRISSLNENLTKEENFVSKRDDTECRLHNSDESCHFVCNICQICFHQYRCTCVDSSINNNMCKHVHAFGIHLLQDTNAAYLETNGTVVKTNVKGCDSGLFQVETDGTVVEVNVKGCDNGLSNVEANGMVSETKASGLFDDKVNGKVYDFITINNDTIVNTPTDVKFVPMEK